jgi:transcriptional regulator with XRE-family HTH domain
MNFEKSSLLQNDIPIVHTVAQLKGRRLRMARALTGFSRQELYEKIGIATSTIDTWESGRVELTEKSAIRVCASLKQVGIYCSSEWLLTGEGNPPRIMDELEKSMLSTEKAPVIDQQEVVTNANKIKKIPPFLSEDIRRELSFFLNLHNKAIYHIVEKDFLNARYKMGDCIAGIEDNVINLSGKIVIAVLENGDTVLCRLLNFSENECSVFISSEKPKETLKNFKAGEVVWHRMSKRLNQ